MIRRACSKDLSAIKELLEEVLYTHYEIRPDIFKKKGQKYSDEELLELFKNDKRPVFVYSIDNKVVAHLFLEIRFYESEAINSYKSIFVDDLCVMIEYRGRGIGKELMNFAFDFARSIGAKDVTLNVWNNNNEALKFYESLGMNIQKFTLEKSI